MTGVRSVLLLTLILAISLCGCTPAVPQQSEREATWLGYFSANYEQARSRFRDGCRQAVASANDYCRSFSVSSRSDSDLTIDYGFFDRGGDRLIVIQSGIHGSEAEAGAAVEAFVLREYVPKLLEKHIDVFFIHTLNPWGFKHDRRTDEFNVNLNRNFVTGAKDYQTRNQYYDQLRSLLEPTGPIGNVSLGALGNHGRFLGQYIGDGLNGQPITIGMNSGQYQYPKGINYGGVAPAQQVSFLKDQLGPIISRPYRKILFLDFHTGLGNVGELSIIKGIHPSEKMTRELESMFGGHEADGIVIRSGNDEGFYPTVGDVIDFVPTLSAQGSAETKPANENILAVTMEYGTLGSDILSQLRTASRMVNENRSYFYGCADPDICKSVRQDFHELFSPSDNNWRLQVMRKADLAFTVLVNQY